MKEVTKKIISILAIMLMLINSSLMLVISVAVDAVQNIIDESKINAIYELNLEKYVNYKVGDTPGLMVQANLKTGIEYQDGQEHVPIEATNVILKTPKVNEEYPEKVEVVTKSTKSTNGDEKGKDFNYAYNKDNGEIKLITENKADENGNVYSENVADARDEYQVILYYGSNCYNDRNEKRELEVSGKLNVALKKDDNEIIKSQDISQKFEVAENVSSLISTDVSISDIYNGYIRSNAKNDTTYRTEYTENLGIQVSYKEIADEVKINTKNLFVNNKDKEIETQDIIYKNTKISKNDVLSELGEEGTLQILDSEGNCLAEINKDSEADDNGYVTVNYENELTELTIKLSKPEKIGDIKIQNVKQIKETMRDTDITKIETNNQVSCINNVKEITKVTDDNTKEEKDVENIRQVDIYNFKNSVFSDIKDAKSDIELSVDNSNWTNNVQNDVTFTATLITNNEKYNLYENPTIDIKLPSEVEKVVLGEASLLYENDLKIKNVSVFESNGCKIIRVVLDGKQKIYIQNDLIKGANIVIPANVILKKDVASINTNIEYTYKNGKESDKYDLPVNIDSIMDKENSESAIDTMDIPEGNETSQSVVQTANIDLDKISVEYKAQLGNQELNDGDSVHEGEYIKYIAKIKNNSNEDVNGLNVIASVPDGTTYVDVETKEITEEERLNKINDECRLTEDTSKKEVTKIVSLAKGEEKEVVFYVKANNLEDGESDRNISSNIKLRIDGKEKDFGLVKNIVNKANLKVTVAAWETKRDNNVWFFRAIVTNEKGEEQKNLSVNFDLNGKFSLTDDKENEGVEKDGNVYKCKISSILVDEDKGENVNGAYIFAKAITTQDEINIANIIVTVNTGDEVYFANPNVQYIKNPILKITQTSDKEGENLKYGDEIEYVFTLRNDSKTKNDFNVNLKDYLDENMKPISVQYDNYIIDPNSSTLVTNKQTFNKQLDDTGDTGDGIFNLLLFIPNGDEVTIRLKATPRMIFHKAEVVNYAIVEYEYNGKFVKTSNAIKNNILPYDYVEPDKPDPDKPDPDKPNPDKPNPDKPNPDKPDPDDPDKPDPDGVKYSISGTAWIDENQNGARETSEKLLPGITVKLFNLDNNSIVAVNDEKQIKTTDEKGNYVFSEIPKGNYIVVFEYDTNTYELTKYKSSEISDMKNSDVINKEVNIDGVKKLVAVTDNISISSENYTNIDIGLVVKEKIDLSLNKSIVKIKTEYNGKSSEKTYDDSKLAKVEIPSKSVDNAVILVEYKIEVKNEGNASASVNTIVDYKPDGFEFDKTLNNNWVMDENENLKYYALTGKMLKPGESVAIELYLTKRISKNSMGIFTNKAEILQASNLNEIKNGDSVEENKNKTEDDYSQAQLIISVKTGATMYLIMIITLLIIICLIIFMKNKKIKIRNISKVLMVFIMNFCLISIVFGNLVKADEYCWDSSAKVYDGNEGLTSYELNGKTFWTHNYRSYGLEEVVGYLFCSDDANMGFMYSDGSGQKFRYYITDDGSSTKEYTNGSSTTTNIADINENVLYNKGQYFKNVNSEYYIIGPYGVTFNGSIDSYSISGKKSDGTETDIGTARISDKDGNEIAKSNITSGGEFYIKIPADSGCVSVSKITMKNKTTKVTTTDRTWKTYEVWKTDDYFEPEYPGQNTDPSQVLKKLITGGNTKDDQLVTTDDSYDSVDIAVQKSIVGSIEITKKDEDTDSKLKGAKFQITGPYSYNQTFTTGDDGKIIVNNLVLGEYKIKEVGAPSGYDLNLQSGKIEQAVTVEAEKTTSREVKNRIYGNLQIEKRDASTNTVIKERGFVFNIYRIKNGKKEYLISYKEGSPSTVVFSTAGTKYRLTTGDDGLTQTLKNIPIDTYYIEEIEIPKAEEDYYEVTKDDGSRNIKLKNNYTSKPSTTTYIFKNQQIYTDVSGYVWEDIAANDKTTTRDSLYSANTKDKLVQGVTVRLIDSKNNKNTVLQTTITDKNGQYKFKKVKITELDNYYIEFEYNGLKYEPVPYAYTDKANGSKAKEKSSDRSSFNSSYSTITSDQIKDNTGTNGKSLNSSGNATNKLIYKNGTNSSTLVQNTGYTVSSADSSVIAENGSVGVKITASTKAINYKLTWVAGSKNIANVNLGIYERTQPDLAIITDLNHMDMTINGYEHRYNFNERSNYINTGLPNNELNNAYNSLLDGFNVSVKNNSGKYKDMTYTRGIYDSYIAYTKDDVNNEARLKVYLTYKIVLKSEFSVPYVKVKSLRNYADSQLDFIDSYIEDGTNTDKKVTWKNTGKTGDSSRNIWDSGEVSVFIEPGKTATVYLTYELNKNTISSLADLNADGGSAYIVSNTTEITSYSSYDSNKNAYAGIDMDSAPGNISFGNISTYEDDTDSAPDLRVVRKASKEISGLVFEDETTVLDTKERLGDGRYDNGNNTVNDVQVELVNYDGDTDYNNDKVVTLYTLGDDGNVVKTQADTKTSNGGKYGFVGIIPGEYVTKYTYGKKGDMQSKILTKDVTTQDYKSTIITNDKLKQAVQNKSEYWYQDTNLENYSSALDDWSIRSNINNNLKNITYSVKTSYDKNVDDQSNHYMVATTGKMTFPIEETRNQTTNYDYSEPSHVYNIKFGIAERPRQSLELTKDISYIKLTLQNGSVLAEGDPRTTVMNYVTYPQNGMLKIEVDNEIIQGSRIQIRYTIGVTNKSETDYNTESYYKYGTKGNTPVSLTVNSIVDYMDEDLSTYYDENSVDWKLLTGTEIKSSIAQNVYSVIKNRKNILVNNWNAEIKLNETKTLDVEASKLISASEDNTFENYTEILSSSNDVGRFYGEDKDGTWMKITHGNFDLTDKTHESDDNGNSYKAKFTIVPPTGDKSIIYYIIGVSCLVVIAGGVVIIKKFVL